jgi:hypothetical protein
LPDENLEPPVLIPVEMVVIKEQPPDPALRLTASEPMVKEKKNSIARSQLSTVMDADQHIDDLADPIPKEGDYQPRVNLETINRLSAMPLARERQTSAGQTEITPSRIPPLHISPADEQISEVAPIAKEIKSEPLLTVDTIPTPSVKPVTPKGKEVASEPVILASQMPSLYLSAVEPSSPAGSTPVDIGTSADLVEAKAAVSPHDSQKGKEVASEPVDLAIQKTPLYLSAVEPSSPTVSIPVDINTSADLAEADAAVSPHFSLAPHKAVTSLVDTQSGDDFNSELRPFPNQVESEPHLMASTLQINSQPNGAQVYIDGMLSGDTPLDMQLTLGKHEVRLALPDHYDLEAQVELTETNQSIPIYFPLLPVD